MELWLVSWRGIGSLAAPRASDRPLPVSPSLPLAWCAAGASWQTKLNISSTHGSIGAVFEGGHLNRDYGRLLWNYRRLCAAVEKRSGKTTHRQAGLCDCHFTPEV
jgi:hypothetical protein